MLKTTIKQLNDIVFFFQIDIFQKSSFSKYLLNYSGSLSLLHPAAHHNKLNRECDELEWIIDQAEITNGFLQSLRLKIYCASGHLLGIIEVCNTVKWAQNTVLIICLHFNPLSIDFHSQHAPPPRRISVSFKKSTHTRLKRFRETFCTHGIPLGFVFVCLLVVK